MRPHGVRHIPGRCIEQQRLLDLQANLDLTLAGFFAFFGLAQSHPGPGSFQPRAQGRDAERQIVGEFGQELHFLGAERIRLRSIDANGAKRLPRRRSGG